MGDPERLLKSGAADPEVRELLQSLRELAPEPRMGVASWGVMAAKVATLPTVVPAPGSALPVPAGSIGTGISHALGLKLVAAAVASTFLGVGAYWVHAVNHAPKVDALRDPRRGAPSVVATAPITTPVTSAAVAAPDPATDETSEAASQTSVTPITGVASPRASRLDAEASLLAKVRSQLHSGDPHGALASLNQLQTAFPNGQLTQERDVLAVEVLAANGNVAAAKRKANAFIAAHPSSPHSAKLERFVESR
jgi:hypothetical protein